MKGNTVSSVYLLTGAWAIRIFFISHLLEEMIGPRRSLKKIVLSSILLPASVTYFHKVSRCQPGYHLVRYGRLLQRLEKMLYHMLHQQGIILVRHSRTTYCLLH